MGAYMKKDTLIKSTIILLIGGVITKILGMIIKLIMTRIAGLEAMSIYMLVFPSFSLFMTISQFGLPSSISKLVSEERHNNKGLLLSAIPFCLLFNLFLMIFIVFSSKFIAINLLKDERCIYPVMAIAMVIPFDSISNILRGYFIGKNKMSIHIISLVVEQIVRLILILLIVPIFKDNIVYVATIMILVNLFSEFAAIIVLDLFIPNKKNIKKDEIKPNFNDLKNVLSISLPTVASRLVGAISYFFEPIILTLALLKNGYDSNYIVTQYGIIEGYVLPLLLLPNFFSNALSSAVLPVISKYSASGNKNAIKKKTMEVIFISLLIGVSLTICLMINPSFFLNILYKENYGSDYIKFLAPFFILLYVESPISSILTAINKPKSIMYHNIFGTLIKIILIFTLSRLKIGLYGFLIAMVVNIILVTSLHIWVLKKEIYSK